MTKTDEQKMTCCCDHNNPDHYKMGWDGVERLASMSDDDIDLIYDKLNGKG